jgi:hypothetical protein
MFCLSSLELACTFMIPYSSNERTVNCYCCSWRVRFHSTLYTHKIHLAYLFLHCQIGVYALFPQNAKIQQIVEVICRNFLPRVSVTLLGNRSERNLVWDSSVTDLGSSGM